jgi:hypothetical protein
LENDQQGVKDVVEVGHSEVRVVVALTTEVSTRA